jgi:hypothetical protein
MSCHQSLPFLFCSSSTNLNLREHLKRAHMLILCRRCKKNFATRPEVNKHAVAEPPCDVSKEQFDWSRGFCSTEQDNFKSRKYLKGVSQADRWVKLYKALFPEDNEKDIPDPCKSDTSAVHRVMLTLVLKIYYLSQCQHRCDPMFNNCVTKYLL